MMLPTHPMSFRSYTIPIFFFMNIKFLIIFFLEKENDEPIHTTLQRKFFVSIILRQFNLIIKEFSQSKL